VRLIVAAILFASAAPALAAPPPNAIIDEGLNRSQVMQTAQYLSDVIGPRITNSPGMRAAEAWTMAKFREWGLQNVHREGFQFGRGWSVESVSVRMLTPRAIQLHAQPIAWTPSTGGALTAEVIVAPIKRERDFDQWRGKLNGKIVLVSLPTDGSEPSRAPFQRLTGEDIGRADAYPLPDWRPERGLTFTKGLLLRAKLDAFLKSEGAVAMVRQSYRDGGLVHGEGYQFETGAALPGIELAAEDYRRIARLAKLGPVKMEIDSRTRFHDDDPKAYNIIAEIPGSDPKAGFVMAGGHLDSWAAGDGAADDGAGVFSVMEAARILAKSGVKSKRTIRFALWAGEEQGLMGSTAYIESHIAKRPAPLQGAGLAEYYNDWDRRFPVIKLAEYDQLAVYFNIDNGSGKLRGIYAEGNLAAVPLLREMIGPFGSMGVTQVVTGKTGGTDHENMAGLGLPAFQFLQDPLDYMSRVHHSNVDTYDHLTADDLRQASTVLASLLLDAANRDKPLPRAVLPTGPSARDPFAYKDPDDVD